MCSRCESVPPLRSGRSIRSEVLVHLARHARYDSLEAYLRTCQCREEGCRWHPRHRGCAGPVLLALTRAGNGRLWRLADACTACATAIAHTAIVPDSPTDSSPRRSQPPRQHGHSASQAAAVSRVRVRDTLSYLAAGLPATVSAPARLLALQCALRADTSGRLHLPAGLLRGMRLTGQTPWQQLEQSRWLRRPEPPQINPRSGTTLLLTEPLTAGTRREHAQAADWALRMTSARTLRTTEPREKLAALALTAHCTGTGGQWEEEHLARRCGLFTQPSLHHTLERLTRAGFLATWDPEPVTGDLHWRLVRPSL